MRVLFALFSLFVFASPAASQPAGMPTVVIAEWNFRIAPAIIHLAAGQPVRLVFTNLSGSGHDFTTPAFFGRAQLLSSMSGRGEVELPGHAQAAIALIPARGIYRAHCTHFGHSMMGMTATIVVD